MTDIKPVKTLTIDLLYTKQGQHVTLHGVDLRDMPPPSEFDEEYDREALQNLHLFATGWAVELLEKNPSMAPDDMRWKMNEELRHKALMLAMSRLSTVRRQWWAYKEQKEKETNE